MSESLCKNCFKLIREGDKVSVTVTATYHSLKSKVAYALDKSDMIADPETLIHAYPEDCDESV